MAAGLGTRLEDYLFSALLSYEHSCKILYKNRVKFYGKSVFYEESAKTNVREMRKTEMDMYYQVNSYVYLF